MSLTKVPLEMLAELIRAAGLTGQIQFNTDGAFSASASFMWDEDNKALVVSDGDNVSIYSAQGNVLTDGTSTSSLFPSSVSVSNDSNTLSLSAINNEAQFGTASLTAGTTSVSSLTSSGEISASNFSGSSTGTNTGDQNLFSTIAVSGQSDVTADTTSDTLTVAAGSGITLTTNASTDTLTISSSLVGLTDGDKGDITVSSSGATWTIDNSAITSAKFRNSVGLSVVGRTANSTGVVADIVAGTDGHVLRRSGTSLEFGTLSTAALSDSSVTFAKMQNISSGVLLGRTTASSGAIEELSSSSARTLLGLATTDNVTFGSVTVPNWLTVTNTVGGIRLNSGDVGSSIDLDFTGVSSAVGAIRLFRSTNTTGGTYMSIHRGDGTTAVDHIFRSGNSGVLASLAIAGGQVSIGKSTANAGRALDVSGSIQSTNIRTATIDLGHDTDTTISRVSSGRIAVEGSDVLMASDIGVTVAPIGSMQTFTTSGTWTKPSTGTMAFVQMWGGGGNGPQANNRGGGGGGAYTEYWVPLASMDASIAVSIGQGGPAGTPVADGGNTTFGTSTIYGGAGGQSGTTTNGSGGGGRMSAGVRYGAGGNPVESGGAYFGGGAGVSTGAGGDSYYGGAGGGKNGPGGNSVYGGGGGTNGNFPLGGQSVFGGRGGYNLAGFLDGQAPGGGGGGNAGGNGSGGRGEVRVTVF